MKKQEKQPVGIQNSNASGGSGVPVPVPGAIKKDDGLFKRVGELLKAGCGAGVLAESTCVSRNELSSHSRICLSLDSGLSLLLPGAAGEWEVQQRPLSRQSNGSGRGGGSGGRGGGEGGGHESDADAAPGDGAGDGETEHGDHHYDLLLRPQEMTRLVRCSGKIGIVTIPHTLGETTGMSDYQLQQLAQQESGAATAAVNMRARSPSKKQLFDPRVESPPRSPGSPGSSKAQRKRGPGGSASAGADGANSGSTAAQAAAGKKASSMVRLGVEARSFEVAVPRGKWTHIALVATALPQNKLTLYMVSSLNGILRCAWVAYIY